MLASSYHNVLSYPQGDSLEWTSFHLTSFHYTTLVFLDDNPKTRSGKIIRRNKNIPTTKHANNYASSLTLKGHLCEVMMILHPGFGYIVIYDFEVPPKVQ